MYWKDQLEKPQEIQKRLDVVFAETAGLSNN